MRFKIDATRFTFKALGEPTPVLDADEDQRQFRAEDGQRRNQWAIWLRSTPPSDEGGELLVRVASDDPPAVTGGQRVVPVNLVLWQPGDPGAHLEALADRLDPVGADEETEA